MRKKIVIRFIFVAVVLVTCSYYILVFQKYLRSASNPMEFLTSSTDGIIKVNDGAIFLNYLQEDSLPLHNELFNDWKLWMNWQRTNPLVGELLSSQSAFWIHMGEQGWFLFFAIPDRWSDDEKNQLLSVIPNLKLWETCLVWNERSFDTQSWKLMGAESVNQWTLLHSKSDGEAAFNFMSVTNQSKVVLDYNEGEWFGFVEDGEWLKNNKPLQLKDSLLGNAMGTQWMAFDPSTMIDDVKQKKRVFSMDTMCQCNVLESWIAWQDEQWKYQTYDGQYWVASQVYKENPYKVMQPFLKDTSAKVISVTHPEWIPQFGEGDFLMDTKFISKSNGKIYLSNDSLSIREAIGDSSKRYWKADFKGYSEEQYCLFEGLLGDFSGLAQLPFSSWFIHGRAKIVVLKSNNNWLIRIAPATE